MSKIKFLRNNAMKGATDRLLLAGARSVGTVAGAYISNKVIPKFFANMNARYPVLIVFLLGILGDVFVEEKYTNAISQGMVAFASLQIAGYILPNQKEALGLSGFGETGGSGGAASIDWSAFTPNLSGPGEPSLEDIENQLDKSMKQMSGVEDFPQDQPYDAVMQPVNSAGSNPGVAVSNNPNRAGGSMAGIGEVELEQLLAA